MCVFVFVFLCADVQPVTPDLLFTAEGKFKMVSARKWQGEYWRLGVGEIDRRKRERDQRERERERSERERATFTY
jgi:hypothetical protein